MYLSTHCNTCRSEIKIKSHASTRPDLAQEKGDEFNVTCPKCGKIHNKHVNDIIAKPSFYIAIAALAISAIVTIALWKSGMIGAITFAIPIIISQQQLSSTRAFNSYRTRRKM